MTTGPDMTTRWRGAIVAGGRATATLFLMAALLLPCGVAALEHGEPVKIGALTNAWGPSSSSVALRDGLVELGYKENEHFEIGVRFVRGDLAKLPTAARELVEFGVDIIFAVGINAAIAAQRATSKLPVIFVNVDDPVRGGLVRSFSRPGENITGVVDNSALLAPKRLEMFNRIVPRLRKVLYVYHGGDPDSVAQAKAYRDSSRQLGVEVVNRMVRTEAEAEAAFAQVRKGGVGGIIAPHTVELNIPGLVLEAASRKGIPSMFPGVFWVERGGLASYAPALNSQGRQAARLVDKIMRGVKPAQIPVETNNEIEFAINLKTARVLGLKINPQVLYQANRIVR